MRHAILIAGDDEDVRCSFAELLGDLQHVQVFEVPVPADILSKIESGEIDQVIFCPASSAKKEAKPHDPMVFVRGKDE